jgi:hypothetical protein
MAGTDDVAITSIGIVGGIDVIDRRRPLCSSFAIRSTVQVPTVSYGRLMELASYRCLPGGFIFIDTSKELIDSVSDSPHNHQQSPPLPAFVTYGVVVKLPVLSLIPEAKR